MDDLLVLALIAASGGALLLYIAACRWLAR